MQLKERIIQRMYWLTVSFTWYDLEEGFLTAVPESWLPEGRTEELPHIKGLDFSIIEIWKYFPTELTLMDDLNYYQMMVI